MLSQLKLLSSSRVKNPSKVTIFVAAALAAVFAVTLQAYLNRFLPSPYFFLFYPAALLVSWHFGFKPALLTIALCILSADFFYFPSSLSFRSHTLSEILALGFVGAATSFAAWIVSALDRKQRVATLAQNELETILRSVGDAVIVVDRNKRVVFLNPVAERLTGWRLEDARGQWMGTVFNIIDQKTRKSAENPAEQVLANAAVAGLMNHTLLISKDGVERQIENSAAPIVMSANDGTAGVVLVFRDVSDRYAAEAAAREAKASAERAQAELHAFFMQAPTPMVILTGPEHRFALANPMYEKYVSREVLGKTLRECFTNEEVGYYLPILDKVYQTGEPYIGRELPLTLWDPDGKARELRIDVSYTAFKDGEGRIKGVLVFVQDVTEQYNARARMEEKNRELELAKEHAETASSLKSAFLANMSHEIRTPLGAMLGFADLLRDPGLSVSERASYTEILSRNGQNLSLIINDILDLSKVEAGHLTLEMSEMKPRSIAEDVVSLLRVKAVEKNLVFEFVCDDSTPTTIVSDPLRVHQILLNLIGNSVKFTSFGSVTVRSFGRKTATGKTAVCFEISDTGIGIPTQHRAKVFEMFVQADGSMTRKYGGTGLGLALSKKLAQELGGDIVLSHSEVGKGSTFVVTIEDRSEIRIKVLDSKRERPPHRRPEPDALRGLKVLVVDDSPDNRHLIWHYLTKHGAIVDSAENGVLGFRKALANNFDIVLMDLQMPEMDGYAATLKLRDVGYGIPIIALTAHAMSEVSQKCLKVGCSAHLPKPIDSVQLITTILELIHPQTSGASN
ncbi:MAG: response regulator [Bdellovibrionaceae bacterium]|nr:response regulator [Pseudobdellovibrionaceae bacterium]